jgi:hypothetical protein
MASIEVEPERAAGEVCCSRLDLVVDGNGETSVVYLTSCEAEER